MVWSFVSDLWVEESILWSNDKPADKFEYCSKCIVQEKQHQTFLKFFDMTSLIYFYFINVARRTAKKKLKYVYK
jgi:hypothetical protein